MHTQHETGRQTDTALVSSLHSAMLRCRGAAHNNAEIEDITLISCVYLLNNNNTHGSRCNCSCVMHAWCLGCCNNASDEEEPGHHAVADELLQRRVIPITLNSCHTPMILVYTVVLLPPTPTKLGEGVIRNRCCLFFSLCVSVSRITTEVVRRFSLNFVL